MSLLGKGYHSCGSSSLTDLYHTCWALGFHIFRINEKSLLELSLLSVTCSAAFRLPSSLTPSEDRRPAELWQRQINRISTAPSLVLPLFRFADIKLRKNLFLQRQWPCGVVWAGSVIKLARACCSGTKFDTNTLRKRALLDTHKKKPDARRTVFKSLLFNSCFWS